MHFLMVRLTAERTRIQTNPPVIIPVMTTTKSSLLSTKVKSRVSVKSEEDWSSDSESADDAASST